MSKLIPRLSAAEMAPELAEMLRPRVERLGYLGEFFQCSGHQPQALMSFLSWTEDLKEALPDSLTELVALTVASWMGNAYERVQHERLALKLGLTEPWLRDVLSLSPGKGESSALTETDKLVQKLVLAVVARNGRGTQAELAAVTRVTGHAQAVAILMLTGRYMTHALMVNALDLAPPVSSPLEGSPVRPGQPLWISEAEV